MAIQLTFLGHSGFHVEGDGHAVVIDPFLSGNDLAKHKPDDLKCEAVLLTHGHQDHVADAEAIAKNNDATIYGAFELANYFGEKGCNVEPANPGGQLKTDFGYVAFTQAFHSSSFEGRYMGMPCGIVVNIGGVTIYHCGDTSLFSDMQLIGEIYQPDIACIPVGDRFTMGPALGARAAELIKPKVAVPIHYKTFPLLVSDISAFKPHGVDVKVLDPGESMQYG